MPQLTSTPSCRRNLMDSFNEEPVDNRSDCVSPVKMPEQGSSDNSGELTDISLSPPIEQLQHITCPNFAMNNLDQSHSSEDSQLLNRSKSYVLQACNKLIKQHQTLGLSCNSHHPFFNRSARGRSSQEDRKRLARFYALHLSQRVVLLQNHIYNRISNLAPDISKVRYANPYLRRDEHSGTKDKVKDDDILTDPVMFNSYRVLSEFSEMEEKRRSRFAVIYHVKDRMGEPYLLKRQKSTGEMGEETCKVETVRCELRNEIQVLRAVCHKNIVRFYDWWCEMEEIYIKLELCLGDSLYDFMWPGRQHDTDSGNPDEERRVVPGKQLASLLHQMSSALVYLHQQGIIHADVKPSNILIQPNQYFESFAAAKAFCTEAILNDETQAITFKLCDFGRAGYISKKNSKGDARYLPFLDETGEVRKMRTGRDIYALGISLFELSGGSIPTASSKESDLLKSKGELPEGHNLTGEMLKTVQRMIGQPPENRPSAIELYKLFVVEFCQLSQPKPRLSVLPGVVREDSAGEFGEMEGSNEDMDIL